MSDGQMAHGRALTLSPHGLFRITIGGERAFVADLVAALGDVASLDRSAASSADGAASLPELHLSYVPRLDTTGLREVYAGVLCGPSALVDQRYGVRLQAGRPGCLVLQSSGAGLEWATWAEQIVLLAAGAAFVHAAGVQHAGHALLFPSWGGVGKTAIVAHFVRNLGWKLLGDDLVMLTRAGMCYGYPKPMVLYPYHRQLFPDYFASGAGPLAPLLFNGLLGHAARLLKPALRRFPPALRLARRHNPQSVQVPPSAVFGAQALSPRAELRSVVWLDRVAGLREPQLLPADSSLPSRLVGSTLREMDQWCVSVTHVACGLGLLGFQDLYPAWYGIVNEGLAHTQGWILYLPSDMPVLDVPAAVHKMLEGAGVFSEEASTDGGPGDA